MDTRIQRVYVRDKTSLYPACLDADGGQVCHLPAPLIQLLPQIAHSNCSSGSVPSSGLRAGQVCLQGAIASLKSCYLLTQLQYLRVKAWAISFWIVNSINNF